MRKADHTNTVGAPILILALYTAVISLETAIAAFVFLFPLFGFQPYDRHSQAFEYIVALSIYAMFVMRARNGGHRPVSVNRHIAALMACYCLLSVFSLIMLPLGLMAKNLILMKLNFTSRIFSTFPNDIVYSFAGVDRLILFSIFAFEFAGSRRLIEHSRSIFLALFYGAVYSAFIGLLEYYHLISLDWYRLSMTIDL